MMRMVNKSLRKFEMQPGVSAQHQHQRQRKSGKGDSPRGERAEILTCDAAAPLAASIGARPRPAPRARRTNKISRREIIFHASLRRALWTPNKNIHVINSTPRYAFVSVRAEFLLQARPMIMLVAGSRGARSASSCAAADACMDGLDAGQIQFAPKMAPPD